jgi:hypothetical protein
MAAKKSASKSKSRTSSKKSKSSLKWWYILPVIAIVAVAGYAIVRFSQAGAAEKRVGSGLTGGERTVDKQGTYGRARVIGNNPVIAGWSTRERGSLSRFCGQFWVGSDNGGNGGVTIQLFNDGGALTNPKTQFGNGIMYMCTDSLSTNSSFRLAFGGDARLKATRAGGYASVIVMYLKQ